MKSALASLLLGALGYAAGVKAYEAGRYAEALDSFTRVERRAGNTASADLLFNRALAALRAGDLRVAEYSAEKAVVRGGAAFEDLRLFLFANTAFGRCERAEAEADLRDADPTAIGRAFAHIEEAIELWRELVLRRDDQPAARRNLERALRKLDELEKKKEEAEQKQNTKKEREPEEEEEEPEDPDAQPEEEEQQPTAQPEIDLSSAELAQLFERLRQMEREKRQLRRERQRVRSADVERDW
jgi:hypothetical protein